MGEGVGGGEVREERRGPGRFVGCRSEGHCDGSAAVAAAAASGKLTWPMTNENKKLVAVDSAAPAARVSSAWISEGTSQPSGPHDHAKAAT